MLTKCPLELRNQIWHDTLSNKDVPALYNYKVGCWCPRRLSRSEPVDEADDKLHLYLEFCHDLLVREHDFVL